MKQKPDFQNKADYFKALTEPPKQPSLPAQQPKKVVEKETQQVVKPKPKPSATKPRKAIVVQPEPKKSVSVRLPLSVEMRLDLYWMEQRRSGVRMSKDQIVSDALDKYLPTKPLEDN